MRDLLVVMYNETDGKFECLLTLPGVEGPRDALTERPRVRCRSTLVTASGEEWPLWQMWEHFLDRQWDLLRRQPGEVSLGDFLMSLLAGCGHMPVKVIPYAEVEDVWRRETRRGTTREPPMLAIRQHWG